MKLGPEVNFEKQKLTKRQNSLIVIIMDCDESRNILCLNRCKTSYVISELPWGLGVSLPRMCYPGKQVIGGWELGLGKGSAQEGNLTIHLSTYE